MPRDNAAVATAVTQTVQYVSISGFCSICSRRASARASAVRNLPSLQWLAGRLKVVGPTNRTMRRALIGRLCAGRSTTVHRRMTPPCGKTIGRRRGVAAVAIVFPCAAVNVRADRRPPAAAVLSRCHALDRAFDVGDPGAAEPRARRHRFDSDFEALIRTFAGGGGRCRRLPMVRERPSPRHHLTSTDCRRYQQATCRSHR
jgi:hypothetical protein